MFKCEHSRFCISPDLVCNGQHNCGQDEHGNKDQSDEKQAFCKLFKNNKVINLNIMNCVILKHIYNDGTIFGLFTGVQESEMNEYVVIGLGLGIISIVMIAVFLLCHRKRKRRRLEHPSNSLEHSSELTIIWYRLIIRIF